MGSDSAKTAPPRVRSLVVLCLGVLTLGTALGGDAALSPAGYDNVWAILVLGKVADADGTIVRTDLEAFQSNILAMGNLLLEKYKLPKDHVILDVKAPNDLADAIRNHSGPNDLVIIHISAHGGTTPDGQYGVKFLGEDVLATGMNQMLTDMKAKGKFRHVVLIVDACHSGAFVETCAGPGRLVMASCQKDELERTARRQVREVEGKTMYFTGELLRVAKEAQTWNQAYDLAKKNIEGFWEQAITRALTRNLAGLKGVHPQISNEIDMAPSSQPAVVNSPGDDARRIVGTWVAKRVQVVHKYDGTMEELPAEWRMTLGPNGEYMAVSLVKGKIDEIHTGSYRAEGSTLVITCQRIARKSGNAPQTARARFRFEADSLILHDDGTTTEMRLQRMAK